MSYVFSDVFHLWLDYFVGSVSKGIWVWVFKGWAFTAVPMYVLIQYFNDCMLPAFCRLTNEKQMSVVFLNSDLSLSLSFSITSDMHLQVHGQKASHTFFFFLQSICMI